MGNGCGIYIHQVKEEGSENKMKIKLSIGSVQVTYSNDQLKSIFEMIIEFKKLNVLRDVDLRFFIEKENTNKTPLHKKLRLMLPFYIIKKIIQNK